MKEEIRRGLAVRDLGGAEDAAVEAIEQAGEAEPELQVLVVTARSRRTWAS